MTPISVVITAHDEGRLAHFACLSALKAARVATGEGLPVELLAIIDRPSAPTARYFSEIASREIRLEFVDFGDPGLARNRGLELARGEYVAYLDADDLFSSRWLAAAAAFHRNDGRRIICHPEMSFYFGANERIALHIDQESTLFQKSNLIAANYWTALAFAPRTAFEEHPYLPSDLPGGFGFEDWHWNCEVMASGWIHKVVPGTAHFVREKADSQRRRTKQAGCLPRPTRLFDRGRHR